MADLVMFNTTPDRVRVEIPVSALPEVELDLSRFIEAAGPVNAPGWTNEQIVSRILGYVAILRARSGVLRG